MPPTAQRIAFLRGHEDAVVCMAVTPDSQLLASGAEDGGLCLHHLATTHLLCRLQCSVPHQCSDSGNGAGSSSDDAETAGVGALVWHPKQHPADAFTPLPAASSGSSGSTPQRTFSGSRLLFAGVGRELLVLLLVVTESLPPPPPALQPPADQPPPPPAAAADVPSCSYELRVLLRQVVSQDDLSSLSINTQGTYLAAADDTGDVLLFDLQKLQQQLQELHSIPQQQQQQQQQQLLQPCRTIAGAHDPMTTAVGFRGPHKPWQLLSGGVDNRVALWDFSRPKKCCSSWNMQQMAGQYPPLNAAAAADGGVTSRAQSNSDGNSHSGSAGAGGGYGSQQGQLWNPPMVHALAMPWALPPASSGAAGGAPGGSGSQVLASSAAAAASVVPSVPAAMLKRLVAVARGDGVVAVFDADPDATKPSARQQQQQQSQSAGVAAAASSSGSSSKSKAGGSKGSKTAGKGGKAGSNKIAQQPQQQQQQQEDAAVSLQQQQLDTVSLQQQLDTVSLQQQQQQQQQRQQQQQEEVLVLTEVPAGFHLCLGASSGGHTLPAASVCFMPWAGGGRYLWSGGQDGKLLLWDWPAAFGAGGAGGGGSGGAGSGAGSGASGVAGSSAQTKQPTQPAAVAPAAGGGGGSSSDDQAPRTPNATVNSSSSSAAMADAVAACHPQHQGSRFHVLTKEHKRKVNALCACWDTAAVSGGANAGVGSVSAHSVLLLVADTAPRISVYRVKI